MPYKTYKEIPKETKQFFLDSEGKKDIEKVPLWYINSTVEEWDRVEEKLISDKEIQELMALDDDELDELEY